MRMEYATSNGKSRDAIAASLPVTTNLRTECPVFSSVLQAYMCTRARVNPPFTTSDLKNSCHSDHGVVTPKDSNPCANLSIKSRPHNGIGRKASVGTCNSMGCTIYVHHRRIPCLDLPSVDVPCLYVPYMTFGDLNNESLSADLFQQPCSLGKV